MFDIKSLNLKTGDLILFSRNNDVDNSWYNYFSNIVKYGTHSNYTHIGMILKDPTFISPMLKGIYIWESGYEGLPDPQDDKVKLGVQITPIHVALDNFKEYKIFIRKIQCNKKHFNSYIIKNIHRVVYNKKYDTDLKDWVNAFFKKGENNANSFWCSSFVGYIYTKCLILKSNTKWSILTPNDFSLDGENLNFNQNCNLEFKEYRIN